MFEDIKEGLAQRRPDTPLRPLSDEDRIFLAKLLAVAAVAIRSGSIAQIEEDAIAECADGFRRVPPGNGQGGGQGNGQGQGPK